MSKQSRKQLNCKEETKMNARMSMLRLSRPSFAAAVLLFSLTACKNEGRQAPRPAASQTTSALASPAASMQAPASPSSMALSARIALLSGDALEMLAQGKAPFETANYIREQSNKQFGVVAQSGAQIDILNKMMIEVCNNKQPEVTAEKVSDTAKCLGHDIQSCEDYCKKLL
jgi:hypothetical protein